MANCVMCGSTIPDNQGSRTCSMCYGDVDHGRDGYYRDYLERAAEREADDAAESEAAAQEATGE
jgi:hypothetical protein